MINMGNTLQNMFGAIAPGMCRIAMNGGIAVKTSKGYKSYNLKTKRLVNCDSFAFDIGTDFFFALPTNHVKVGDIIIASTGKPCCVVDTKDTERIEVINYEDNTVQIIIPERHMFMGNMYFFTKIVTPFKTGSNMKGTMKYLMMMAMMNPQGASTDGTQVGAQNPMGFMQNPMMAMMLMGSGGMDDMFNGMFEEEGDFLKSFDENDDSEDMEDGSDAE